MPQDRFKAAFRRLHLDFTAKTKRRFLDDIQGQIEEDDKIQRILGKPFTKPRLLGVTFDRRRNDKNFSYSYFDLILVTIDRISRGKGIYKPSNQMRALQWNGSRGDLELVLDYFAQNNTQVRFYRSLILPFPTPPIGKRVDKAVHKR